MKIQRLMRDCYIKAQIRANICMLPGRVVVLDTGCAGGVNALAASDCLALIRGEMESTSKNPPLMIGGIGQLGQVSTHHKMVQPHLRSSAAD